MDLKKNNEVGSFVENLSNIDKTSIFLLLEMTGKDSIMRKTKEEESMETVFEEKEKTLILKIREEIDDYKVQEIRRKADYEIQRYMPKKVVFDFDKVTFMDSAGIGQFNKEYKKNF